MKKILLGAAVLAAMGISTGAKAQLIDEQNVTITMDLQPILQLKMNGPQNIDFVFDQISKYVGGITKYGATQLMVSSTVNWDLYAVGYSSQATTQWDNQVMYGQAGGGGLTGLPIDLLEMKQDKPNQTAYVSTGWEDYSNSFLFSPTIVGQNNIYASTTPYVQPPISEKYINGGIGGVGFYGTGGTYLVTNASGVGATSDFYYSIDYRIVPGLPVVFPNAQNNLGTAVVAGTDAPLAAGTFAQPGVYTMNVKYVLMEDF